MITTAGRVLLLLLAKPALAFAIVGLALPLERAGLGWIPAQGIAAAVVCGPVLTVAWARAIHAAQAAADTTHGDTE